MNQDSTADVFRQKLEESYAAERAAAFPMEFEGFPCKVRPLGLLFFVRAGRMPEHLTQQVIANSSASTAASAAAPASTPEELVAGEVFMRKAFCAVMAEPQVVESEPVPEGGYLFADLEEKAPKFVAAVMNWIKRDCPMPTEEKGEGVLGVEDLERFLGGAGRESGVDARDTGEGIGAPAVGTTAPGRKRTGRKRPKQRGDAQPVPV